MGLPPARRLAALCVSHFHELVLQAREETLPVVINRSRKGLLREAILQSDDTKTLSLR